MLKMAAGIYANLDNPTVKLSNKDTKEGSGD
jgi:hypothetical protein